MNPPQEASDFEKVPISRSGSDPLGGRRSRALRPEHPEGVGLVHEQAGAGLRAHRGDLGHRGPIALHGVDAVNGHQRPARGMLLPPRAEPLVQARRQVVAEGAEDTVAEPGAVDEAGVAGGIQKDGVVGLDQRGQQAHVGQVSGREHQGGLGAHPVGQLVLELAVQRQGAVHQAAAGTAGPVPLDGLDGRPLDPFVAGQSEVVVGSEHDDRPPVVLHHRTRLAGHLPVVGDQTETFGRPVVVEPRSSGTC